MPTRYSPAVVFCFLCFLSACAGIPDLSTMATQMAGGASPGAGAPPGEAALGSQPDNNVALPDAYSFSYSVTLRVTTDQGSVDRVFYMQPDASFTARAETKNGNAEYLVYDIQNELVVLFARVDGEKRRVHNRMNLETKAALIGGYRDAPEREVRPLDSKPILGYSSRGYEISTLAGTTRLWVTDQAPATLHRAMFEHRAEASGAPPLSGNSMIMEMSFESAHAPEKSYHMEVTEIRPETLVLNAHDYTAER